MSTAAPWEVLPNQIVELDTFDTAFAVRPGEEREVRRRFMTLLVSPEPAPQRGAVSTVVRVENTECVPFALKTLRLDVGDDELPRALAAQSRQLYEEYVNQLAVSHLRGFPRLYGYGTRRGVPVILMEWVDGLTLRAAHAALEGPDGRVPARTVAALGRSVLRVLLSAESLDETFVHRDLSPRNIMLRTDSRPLEEQLRRGDFDVCLVDLGSATLAHGDTSLTMTAGIWRNGTPDYAPPEMLTRDVAGVMELRGSSTIDVYALASVLYELYAGRTPFELAERLDASPYRIKMDEDFEPLVARDEKDGPLVRAITAGLSREQDGRPSARELHDALSAVLGEKDWDGGAPRPPRDAQDESGRVRLTRAPEEAAEVRAGFPRPPEGAPAPAAPEADPGAAGGRPVTRRALVLGAAGVVVAAAAAGAGILLTRRRGLADYGWRELREIADELSAAASDEEANAIAADRGLLTVEGLIDASQTKPVLIGGVERAVQVWGIRHDERADGSGLAGLTLGLTEVALGRAMDEDPAYDGGWMDSGLRAWLNDGAGLLGMLPTDLADAISPVLKPANNVGAAEGADDVTSTADALWVPSYVELVGERAPTSFAEGYHYLADVLNAEGAQYRIFSEAGQLARGTYDALIRMEDGAAAYWWLRSASPDVSASEGSTYFNRTAPNGDPFHYATSCADTSGVLPCFCL